MEFNNPSEIVKNLSFGMDAREKIMTGVQKLTDAVESTLGASGKCVIYEDLSLIHISSPRDRQKSRMPSSA